MLSVYFLPLMLVGPPGDCASPYFGERLVASDCAELSVAASRLVEQAELTEPPAVPVRGRAQDLVDACRDTFHPLLTPRQCMHLWWLAQGLDDAGVMLAAAPPRCPDDVTMAQLMGRLRTQEQRFVTDDGHHVTAQITWERRVGGSRYLSKYHGEHARTELRGRIAGYEVDGVRVGVDGAAVQCSYDALGALIVGGEPWGAGTLDMAATTPLGSLGRHLPIDVAPADLAMAIDGGLDGPSNDRYRARRPASPACGVACATSEHEGDAHEHGAQAVLAVIHGSFWEGGIKQLPWRATGRDVIELHYPSVGPGNRELSAWASLHVEAMQRVALTRTMRLLSYSQGVCQSLEIVGRLDDATLDRIERFIVLSPAEDVVLAGPWAERMEGRCRRAKRRLVHAMEADPHGAVARLLRERTEIFDAADDSLVRPGLFELDVPQRTLVPGGHLVWLEPDVFQRVVADRP